MNEILQLSILILTASASIAFLVLTFKAIFSSEAQKLKNVKNYLAKKRHSLVFNHSKVEFDRLYINGCFEAYNDAIDAITKELEQ
jgi:hypothetical protein